MEYVTGKGQTTEKDNIFQLQHKFVLPYIGHFIAESFNTPTLKGLQWNYNARGRLKVGDQGGVLRSWLTRWLYHLCATGPRLAVGPVHPGGAVFQGSSKMLIQPKIDEGVAGYIGHCQHVTDEENK